NLLLTRVQQNKKTEKQWLVQIMQVIGQEPYLIKFDGQRILDKIMATKDLDLITLALKCVTQNLVVISPYPSYFNVVQIDKFDFNKLELSTDDYFDNLGCQYWNLSYDGNSNWVVALPKMYFSGFRLQKNK